MKRSHRAAAIGLTAIVLAAAPWLINASAAATHDHASHEHPEEQHSHEPVTTEEEAERRWNPDKDKSMKIKKNDDGTFTITRDFLSPEEYSKREKAADQ